MQTHNRGVRRLTHGFLAGRELARSRTEAGVSRKDLSSAARDASQALRLRPAMRQVLYELVGSYGEQELKRGLIVWPSNVYLQTKTGLSERAVRNCLRDLTESRLVVPVDSPNRKRFPIKNHCGTIVDAYGFDLSPLIVRRAEFAGELLQMRLETERTDVLFDEITVARKAIEEALHQLALTYPHVSIVELVGEFDLLARVTPRRGRSGPAQLEGLVDGYSDLRARVEKLFHESGIKVNGAGCTGQECRHLESNNGSPSGPCQSGSSEIEPDRQGEPDLGLVLMACPAAGEFGGPIADMAGLVLAGRALRATIGAHPSAWSEAVDEIGAVKAAIAVLMVLQLHSDDVSAGLNRIKNPGGLFRAMVRRIKAGACDLATELRALRRRHMG